MINEIWDEDKSINYIKEYYEDTDNHYLNGIFHEPYVYSFIWEKCRTRITKDGYEIEAIVFRDRNENQFFDVMFVSREQKRLLKMYDNRKLLSYNDAKRLANYRLLMHLEGRLSVFDD